MRGALNGLFLTLAGVGFLSGSAMADGPRLHEEVRGRVAASLGAPSTWTAESVREALRNDPSFEGLIQYLRARTGRGVRRHDGGDDAQQDALLKIWRGRPEIFLKPHEEVLKYLRTANGRNLLTEIDKSSSRRAAPLTEGMDPPTTFRDDPTATVEAMDLVRELHDRLDDTERAVLEARLDGNASERAIARSTGMTRHAVAQAMEGVHRKLNVLIAA